MITLPIFKYKSIWAKADMATENDFSKDIGITDIETHVYFIYV